MRARPVLPSRTDAATPVARRVPVINGLRGVAIIAVVYFHVVSGIWSPATVPPLWISPLLINGWTGVNLFFILSGFVLFLPFAADSPPMFAFPDRLRFYRRRALRLLPLFYVAVLLEWAFAALRGTTGPGELFAVLSLRLIIDPASFFPSFNGPLWSIGVEIAFSALFPMLVLAGRRFGMIRLTAFALAVALAFRLLGDARFPGAAGISFNTDMFLCRLDEFVLGMLAARLYVARCLPRRPGLCLWAGVALIVLAWTGFDMTTRHLLPVVARAGLNDVLDAGFFGLLLAALVPGTALARALSWRPLQLLGMMCYSIYIWHWPLLAWLMPDRATMPAGRFVAALIVYLAVTLAIAVLSYRFIEFGRIRAWRPLFLLDPPVRAAPLPASRITPE